MQKRLYEWEIGGHLVRRVFVIGNYGTTAAAYTVMLAQIQVDFPGVAPEDVEYGQITQSSTIKGYALATCLVPNGATVPQAYIPFGDRADFSY